VVAESTATPDTELVLSPLSATSQTLLEAIQALGLELDSVRQEGTPQTSARLAVAEDELTAIHDEMRHQQEEIESQLVETASSRIAMVRRFLSSLPLATILTNPSGMILEANAAAHVAMRVSQGRLVGRPIFAYIAPDDRRRLRSALSSAGQSDEILQITGALTVRHATSVPAYLALVRELGELRPAVLPDAIDHEAGIDTVEEPYAADQGEIRSVAVRWVIMPDYTTMDRPPSHQQLEALTRLCRLGANAPDLQASLAQVVKLCLRAVAEADDVSLLVGNPLEPTFTIATSALAQHVDGLQYARAKGPALEAYRSRRPVALDGEALAEHPGLAGDSQVGTMRSLLAVPLLAETQTTSGVLTLYTSGPTSVATTAALRQVMPFVEAAQSLIQDKNTHEEMRRTQQQLESALLSRAVIDQAKGMIKMALKCDADEAFSQLVRMSSNHHDKVHNVAQGIVNGIVTKGAPALWPAPGASRR
jgi:PAS domain-containing protein